MPGICRTALAAIAELKTEHGIACTPDEIVRLHELSRRMERPDEAGGPSLLEIPVRCGNATLWHLTVAGEIWWHECACRWWADSDLYLTASLGFAMARGREADALPAERPLAFLAVRAWFRELRVSKDELNHAILDVMARGQDSLAGECHDLAVRLIYLSGDTCPDLEKALEPILARKSAEKSLLPDWPEMLADLAVSTGTTPDYWIVQSREQVVRLYVASRRHAAAAAGLGFADDEAAASARFDAALRRQREEMVAIVAAHKKEQPA